MSQKIKVAVIQAGGNCFDKPAMFDKFKRLAKQAAGEGAKLAVFPEAFIGGYPKGLDFGMRLGMRSEAGRDDFLRYANSSVDLMDHNQGSDLDQLCQVAKDNGLHITVGVIEKDGGTLYCTAVYLGADGAYLGKHRKLMPTALERGVWGQGDGSTITVVESDLGKIGGAICWENRMPLLRTALYAKGVQLYCAPTVDDRDNWIPSMQHIAQEGRCFVLSSCQYLTRGDAPDDYNCIQGDDPNEVLIRGGSCIVDPFGNVLAGPLYNEEGVVTAEIDMDQITRGQYDMDVVGHYARPDIFDLRVNEAEQRPVKFYKD